MKFLWEQGMV